MFPWLSDIQIAIGVAASVGAGGLGFYRLVWRPGRVFAARIAQGLEHLQRLDLDRLEVAMGKVDSISAALGPNGGKSLGDAVMRIERLSRRTAARVTGLGNVSDAPFFEADKEGRYIWCNSAFESTFGYSSASMEGMGWVNLIHPEDRERVVRDWKHCVEDKRAIETTCRYVHRSGTLSAVRVSAFPVPDEVTDEVIGWMGRVEAMTRTA